MDEISFLREIVAVYSPTGHTDRLVKFLVKECSAYGYKCHQDKAGNFIGEIGNGAKTILLVGHIDTVPGEILVRKDGNKLYGRGSVDAKGCFAAFISSSIDIKDKKIIVVGCCDEEGPSEGAKFLLNKYKPDFIVIGEPSGYNAITLGYKGCIWVDYLKEKDNFHSSIDQLNALEEAIKFYNSLSGYCENFNNNKNMFNKLNMTINNMDYANDGLKQKCQFSIRLRVPIGYDHAQLMDYIEQKRQDAIVTIRIEEKPIKSGKNNILVKSFLKSIREHGFDPRFKLKSGTSDMNILGNHFNCPIVAYGPGDSSMDHTPNENVDIGDFQRSIQILKKVLIML